MLKNRKYIVLFGMLLAMICGLLGLAACGGEHVHDWGEWETVTAATCTAEGSEQRACKECEEKEVRATEKAAHTPTENVVIEPTCLTEGYTTGSVCSVCGTQLHGAETMPALGHEFGGWVQVTPASCTDQGLEKRTCTRENCGAVEDHILDMTPHTIVTFGENRDATCTEPGEKAGERCSVCEHVVKERETIPALGHEIAAPVHYVKDGMDWHKGTCTRPGCDHTAVDEPCPFNVVKTAATCTAAEHHVHTCPTCDFTYEHDEGSPLGHNFGDWHFDVEAYDNSLRDADGAATVVRQHRRVCSNPGHVADPAFPEVEACTEETVGDPVLPTCTTSGYTNYRCTECENTYTGDRANALGHSYKKDASGKLVLTYEKYYGMDTHYKECETCGQKSYYSCRYETAQFLPADCEHGKRKVYTCTDCGSENTVETGEALGHAYGAWTHDDTTSGSTSKHYRICGRAECGHRDEADCVMQSSDIAATCQKPGQAIQICKDCKYNEQGGVIAQLEHDVTGQPYTADRTNGRHYQTCKRCNERVYGKCPYELTMTPKSCTEDEKTRYYCPTCGDDFTVVTQNSAGHTVTEYTHSDKFYHTGRCDICKETVPVPHDFSESNLCKVCHTDGLTYAFETGSGKTQAKVIRTVQGGFAYNINTPKIVIPEEVDIDGSGAVPVVGIGTDAFFGNRNFTAVELPLSLTYIGYNAFYGCTSLADVHFAGHEPGEQNVRDCKLNRIEGGAFYGCTALTDAILPSTLQYIGAQAFRGCTLLDDIEIPELVTEIEDHAFMDTKYFNDPTNWVGDVLYIGKHLIRARTSLPGTYTVNAGVVSISAEAFMDCKYLTGIELPATLKAIDRDAFKGCDSLTAVVFGGTFEEYLGIRFDNNEASPMHVATALTFAGESGALTVPDGATVIPAGAFRGSDIQSIVIPASVTSIGAGAFADCASLTSITFARGSGLISIGADVVKGTAFYNDPDNWTDGVLYLRDEDGTPVALVAVDQARVTAVFEENYRQVEIAEGTRVVAPEAFKGFETLRYVVVPGTVVFLGEGVFEGCTALNRVNFRGTGLAWFCYSPQLGRVYTDASVYGGAENGDVATQQKAANMFKTYTLQWKRGNYGSGK